MMRRGQDTGAKYGFASVAEAGIGLDACDILAQLEEERELTARFNLYVFPKELDNVVEKGWTTGNGTDKYRKGPSIPHQ